MIDYPNKAPIKTTKSALDVQMISAISDSKHKKGISFYSGASHNYMFIPNSPNQTFHYFYNPSKLTIEQRKLLGQKILLPKEPIVDEILETIDIIDDL